ncbi:MAG: NAD-dependent epimerase/dehydratase family protein [Ignavibacteriales bacterium]|nr:NAD-dependent epimerase/dehydratase family protein [Ignavibacteriales bacterium]
MSNAAPPPPLSAHLAGEAVLVTGASGFVGGRLARRLLRWTTRARTCALYRRSWRSSVPRSSAPTWRTKRRCAPPAWASEPCLASRPAWAWGPRAEFERTNIGGARVVVAVRRMAGVRRLVFTSSPSVVFNDRDLAGVDESQPLGTVFPADYPRTKAEAERIVLAANTPGALATCALRPHLVFGPGDQNPSPGSSRGRARVGCASSATGTTRSTSRTSRTWSTRTCSRRGRWPGWTCRPAAVPTSSPTASRFAFLGHGSTRCCAHSPFRWLRGVSACRRHAASAPRASSRGGCCGSGASRR